jgi:hypothetical protein
MVVAVVAAAVEQTPSPPLRLHLAPRNTRLCELLIVITSQESAEGFFE